MGETRILKIWAKRDQIHRDLGIRRECIQTGSYKTAPTPSHRPRSSSLLLLLLCTFQQNMAAAANERDSGSEEREGSCGWQVRQLQFQLMQNHGSSSINSRIIAQTKARTKASRQQPIYYIYACYESFLDQVHTRTERHLCGRVCVLLVLLAVILALHIHCVSEIGGSLLNSMRFSPLVYRLPRAANSYGQRPRIHHHPC